MPEGGPANLRVVAAFMAVVYEKDIGDTTLEEFKKMERFNPNKTWTPVEQ